MKLPSFRDALRVFRSAGDGWLFAWILLIVASGLVPVATVFVTRQVVDALTVAVRGQGDSSLTGPLIFWAVAAGLVVVVTQILQGAMSWVRAVQTELLCDEITSRIHEKSAEVDLAFYDSPEFFDHLHRAREEASFRPAALLEACGDVLQGSITLVGMAAMLLLFGWWLPLALLAGALPVLLVVSNHALAEQKWRREMTADERRTWYQDEVLTSTPYAAELRLFNLGAHFQSAHRRLRATLREQRLDLVRRRGVSEGLAGLGGLLVTGVAFGVMVWRAVAGIVTLGQLAAFYQAFSQGLSTLRQLLGGLGRIYANSLFMENLFAFLELQPRIVDATVAHPVPSHLERGIRFSGVTFRYPAANHAALDKFDLFIEAGQSVAIVGPNGSGKSTLVKLITRLYDPNEGAIEIDDVNLRDFGVAELRQSVTVLFQEPARYAQSVADNIRMGMVGMAPRLESEDRLARPWAVDGQVERAAAMAGARFADDLPSGYETLLGTRFAHGTELSTGEWQRIALARAFLRPSSILVLDEPTSALDPWAEADWYRRFRQAARGRTSIVITHRFTTAMQADMIHVMEHGRIVESGTHQELMASGGRYAASWAEQTGEWRGAGRTPIAVGVA